jgi:drug/metabolite transporter (DMT)-like permease
LAQENPARLAHDAATTRRIGILLLIVTATGWSLGWSATKVLLQSWPPLFARGLAGMVASFGLAALALGRGESLRVPRAGVPRLVFAAFTNVFAWMGFSALSLNWVSVPVAILLVFTMPIWATLFAWPLAGQPPTGRGIAALLLGFAGVVVLLSGQDFTGSNHVALGIALALGAAILFALGGVLNRAPHPLPPVAATAWQVGLGCLPMVTLGLAFEHPAFSAITPLGLAMFGYVTVIGMGVCYLTWFATLRRLPPATASVGTLLIPLLGIVSSALLIGEPLGLRELIAVVLTLGGVTLALTGTPRDA